MFPTADDATVFHEIVPVGMFVRNASTPFTYTTAPSSRRILTVAVLISAAFETVIAFRKYVVMYRTVPLRPATTVTSSPSP